jgi:PadR family transcriptional regulator, regulatory protein PadR
MKENNTSDPKLTAIEEDILTVLLGRELYGLSLLECLNTQRPSQLSSGSLYPALNTLEKKGYISWRWGDETESSSGARRKYYKITALGYSVLNSIQHYRKSLLYQSDNFTFA